MYVTYDLPQETATGDAKSELVVRGAKEFQLPAPPIRWTVGQFDNASGAKSYGVRLEYFDPVKGLTSGLVEVPVTATNVQVHLRALPSEYRKALGEAA